MDISKLTMTAGAADNSAEKARALQRRINPDGTGLTKGQLQQAKKVSQDFEALFTGMMLKSMRSTIGEDKLTGGGKGEEIYRSLLDQEYAEASAKRGDLGLARQIEKEIIRQESRTLTRQTTLPETK